MYGYRASLIISRKLGNYRSIPNVKLFFGIVLAQTLTNIETFTYEDIL